MKTWRCLLCGGALEPLLMIDPNDPMILIPDQRGLLGCFNGCKYPYNRWVPWTSSHDGVTQLVSLDWFENKY